MNKITDPEDNNNGTSPTLAAAPAGRKWWEAYSTDLAGCEQYRYNVVDSEDGEGGPSRVWVCGHSHLHEWTAEACAERACRQMRGPDNSVPSVWVRRKG